MGQYIVSISLPFINEFHSLLCQYKIRIVRLWRREPNAKIHLTHPNVSYREV
ncbi:hypothetical protein HMPREF0972_00415 [Actinomyces sp. oral taxon 848 str. F0332]|nr:hypothetical protein HMPREF0972_00415 [Actinomyces sp. oral taxon 848 str. F0332]